MERSTDDHNILFISILHSLPPGSFDIGKTARFRQMLRQLFDAGTARPVERRAVPFIHLLAQAGQRAGDVLVRQHAHHRAHLAAFARQAGQAPGQITGGVRIVRHIEDQRRLPPHDLEAPRQRRLLQPGEDRPFVDFQRGAVQRRQCGSGIGQRHVRRRQIGQQRIAALPLPAIALLAEAPGFTAAIQRRAQRFGDLANAVRHVGFAHYRRLAAAENTGLFTANAFTIVAQPIGVIERDAGDHRHARIDDVGGVETPAQAHFQDHHVEPRLFEQLQRRQGAEFEIGQRRFAAAGFNGSERAAVLRFAQLFPLNAHALGIAHQMWRTVDADAQAGGQQNSFESATGGAFAVGAGNGEHRRSGSQ